MPLVVSRSLRGILLVALACVLVITALFYSIYRQIPSKEKVRGCITTEMYHVNLCPGSKDYVALKNISKHLQQAIVLTEDSAFWDHKGFDFQEIQNSFEKNLEQGRFARGGSTITQQLAKNMFLSADKSLQRKILEAIITMKIEKSLNKKEILERYLNVVQFGKDIFGVKKAAQFYFKKSPADLDVIESAFLAFLLPSPEKYSVSYYKKTLTPFAQQRLQQIANNLYRYGRIEADDYRYAMARMHVFLTGGTVAPAPEGLDLNAPEESFEGELEDLLLEPESHTADRPAGEKKSEDNQDSQMDSEDSADIPQSE